MPTDVIIDPSTGQIYWNDNTGSPQSISIKGDALNAISVTGYSASFSPGSAVGGTTTLVTFNDNSGTAVLVPGTTGFELGSGTLRWKFYGTTGNFSDSTLSSSLLTGSVLFNGGIAISGNASIGQSLLLYGAGTAYSSYTGFKAGSVTSNTIYTLPLTYPGTGNSVLQSDTSGVLSWVPMTASSSSSGGTVSSGTQYQVAGYYSGTGASVSGSSTFTNNTALGQVQILHTTASTGTSTGALQVAGGVGISGRLSFNQASFGTTGIASNPTMAMIGQTGDPIFMSILEDNSISFEGSQGQLFSISPNLTSGYIWAVNDISGVPLLRASAGGTVYISEFGGVLGIGQTNPTYKLDLKGSFGLASSNDGLYNFIFSNSAASGSNSLQIRSANSLQLYNSGNTFYTALKSNAASNVTYTLPTTDGSNGQFLQTNGTGTLTWATASGGSGSGSTGVNPGGEFEIGYYAATGASISGSSTFKNNTNTSVVSITHSTASTNFGNGALTVSGGVGIGGSLFVGGIGASISGVIISSGAITAGTWNGTVVGTQYGGTGQNFSASSGLIRLSSGTASVISSSSDLANTISDETGSGSLVFATNPVLVTPNIGAATGTSLYLSAVSPSTSTTTGALRVPGGVGIGLSLSIGGYLQLFNGSNFTAFVSSATGNTVYTLPATSPATGSSVLQSTSTGIMSWVPMVASGGAGSGTVAIPDAQYRLAYYAGTGASVSSTNLITAVGTGISILGATNATSTTVAALSILGGLGITGNAFIGGTINAPSTSLSLISGISFSNGAITVGAWNGTAISPQYGGTGQNYSASSGILKYTTGTASLVTAPSGAIVGTTDSQNLTNKTYNNVTITAPATNATLTIADTTTLATSGAFNLTLTTTALTNVTFPSGTKTLVATDVTSLASLTTASSLNSIGTITTGTWAGTTITAFYGGTGFSNYSVGDILYASTGNSLGKLPSSSNSGYVLTSNGANTAPSWQAVPPAAASSVAVAPTAVNGSFSITAVNVASGTGLGLSTIASLVINPSTGIVSLSGLAVTATTQSTSSSTGALIVTNGAAVGQTLSIGGSLNIFNGANYTGFRFAGSANTTYILPPRTPTGTGTSYLSSSIDGVMAWVAAPTGGSATPGGSNKQIQYNSSNTFAGASGFEYTTGGNGITVSMFSPSGTGYTAGLWVHSINGTTTRVGIGLSNPAYELEILGEISATNKSFVIDHPTKDGMKLRYGSLEGPENGVYVRGELKNSNIIEVPEHWLGLVHPDSYTVHLTPIGRYAQLYVEKIENYNVFISDANMNPIHCYYSVWAERKDIPKLITEYEAQ